ncbi:FAD-linked oxidoreductase apf9 [Colletotrichum higginsianum]|uniref:FAD-linked oxidoreductase apf9 n=1 Tax=Colletotrichum higginsianum TaxID=80884 RepID=A0A4T0VWS5_9PEZI|nr:FAD-linked oxidoreductase apf9 [Colletotrichum higginsianum]
MMTVKSIASFFALVSALGVSAQQTCKLTPLDAAWPTEADWSTLNTTLGGSLLQTRPIASSCYPGNPFHSSQACDEVKKGWGYSYYHASLPESIDSPLYANNSCLPPGAPGYSPDKGCELGGSPVYVVNATNEDQIATAMRWASERNIRIVIKGTGHDLNGRSSGAYSLSIWTHNFQQFEYNAEWRSPSDNRTEAAITLGSGHSWGSASRGAAQFGRVVVGGVDESVGVGGHMQGGGHGPLSSTFSLAADQILQARVVTVDGRILVANEAQHQDLLWAIRGGGAGQYGVVTEYVIKAHPNPGNVVSSAIEVSATGNDTASKEAAWRAFAVLLASVPDLMDVGLTGTGIGTAAAALNSSSDALRKATGSISFFTYNTTQERMSSLLEPVRDRILAEIGNSSVSVSLSEPSVQADFMTFFESVNEAPSAAGTAGLMTSRLLGRKELSDIPIPTLASHLQQLMVTQDPTGTALMVIGLQGGQGPRNAPEVMRGSLNPAWRSAYIHMMSYGASADPTLSPQEALNSAAKWLEETKEPVWREWAPGSGAYMNEGNAFNTMFKEDFYGAPYDRLVTIKRKYDPTESLFVLSGVGSDAWEYDLNSGRLCKTSG